MREADSVTTEDMIHEILLYRKALTGWVVLKSTLQR